MPMLLSRRLFALALGVTALLANCSLASAQPNDENVIIRVSRVMGFRPQEFFNERSDYSFFVDTDGNYEYQAFAAPGRDDGYKLTGKLSFSVEEFESRIGKLGVDDIKAPDPNEPQIADAPEVNISRPMIDADWQRTVFPSSEIGQGLHAMIGQIVMGIVEAPADVKNKLMQTEPTGVNQPRVITSAKALEELLGAEGAAWAESLDFEKQTVVAFRWAGSGQDEMYAFREGEGDQMVIKVAYQAGFTRDLRQHAQLFAMPKNAKLEVIRRAAPRF